MSQPKVTVTFKMERVDDNDPDLSYLEQDYSDVTDAAERAKYKAQDAERLMLYKRNDWYMIGIRAKAMIIVRQGNYATHYTLESPGVWGIESDSADSYLESVYKEECSVLQTDIAAMGAAEFKL